MLNYFILATCSTRLGGFQSCPLEAPFKAQFVFKLISSGIVMLPRLLSRISIRALGTSTILSSGRVGPGRYGLAQAYIIGEEQAKHAQTNYTRALGIAGLGMSTIIVGMNLSFADASTYANKPLTKEDIAAASAAIEDLLDNSEDDGLGPTLVRLAWHASGTYDKESHTGGSDGATMRFEPESAHGANAGLHIARNALEPVKKQFPHISYVIPFPTSESPCRPCRFHFLFVPRVFQQPY